MTGQVLGYWPSPFEARAARERLRVTVMVMLMRPATGGSASASTSSPVCVQVMISNVPSWLSATAVQLSTQSPQLM